MFSTLPRASTPCREASCVTMLKEDIECRFGEGEAKARFAGVLFQPMTFGELGSFIFLPSFHTSHSYTFLTSVFLHLDYIRLIQWCCHGHRLCGVLSGARLSEAAGLE